MMRVVFSDRAYASVLAETTEKIRTETGGLFLGAYEDGAWYIIEAIDPGPKSIFEVAYFEYDQAYTQHLIRKIANLYARELRLIGLWHRHPGSFDAFSSTDNETNAKYAKLNEQGAISALVNIDPRFRVTMYHVAKPCKYTKILYSVGDQHIPSHLSELKKPEAYEAMMERLLSPATAQNDITYQRSVSLAGFLKVVAPFLHDRLCDEAVTEPELAAKDVMDKMIDALVEDIAFLSDEAGVIFTVAQREKHLVFVQETVDGTTRVYFAYCEKDDKLVFEYKGKVYAYESGLFSRLFRQATQAKAQEAEQKPAPSLDEQIHAAKKTLNSVIRHITNSLNGGHDNGHH